MPTWTLRRADGVQGGFDVSDYRKTKSNVVLSFAVKYKNGTKTDTETYMLAPRHRHKEVPEAVQTALDFVSGGGAAAGYEIGSAAGMVAGLGGAALGLVLGHLAKHVVDEFFSESVVDDGDYYDSRGRLGFSGLITLKG